MQNPNINIKVWINWLKDVISYCNKYRSDEGFAKIITEADKLAYEINVEPFFPPIQTVRPRRKPKHFDYEQNDEVVVDPKINFKIEFFYRILDQTLSSLNNRFEELKHMIMYLGFQNLQLISLVRPTLPYLIRLKL